LQIRRTLALFLIQRAGRNTGTPGDRSRYLPNSDADADADADADGYRTAAARFVPLGGQGRTGPD